MRLSAQILENVYDVNSYEVVSEAHLSDGGPNYMYIQLIDKSKHELRYITQATAYSVSALFSDIDDSQEFEIAASQPFSDDKSIWKIDFLSTQIPNSGAFVIKLIEDGVERKFKVDQSLIVDLLNDGGC